MGTPGRGERRGPGRPRKAEGPASGVEERILDSACSLFHREGVHAVGVDRVLAEAGAAKASLYAHFDSKDALVTAYLERRSRETQERLRARMEAGGGDAQARLLRLFDVMRDTALGGDYRGCPFLNAASEIADPRHPALAVVRRHRRWLEELIRGLVAATGVREVERTARAILVLCDGAASATLADRDARAAEGARWAAARLLAP